MGTGFPRRNYVLLSLWLMLVLFFSTVINNHNDIVKQWVAVKCALDGVSPYALALKVLDSKIGPVKAKTINLWEIRGYVDGGEAGEQGLCQPTDATYSPAALGFLMLSVGALDKDYQVVILWFFLNMLAIVCILRSETMRALDDGGTWFGFRKSLVVFAAFFPVVFTLQIGQFSLLVLAGALCALDHEEKPIVSGLFMFLMLLKPTLGVPLLGLFLGREYRRALAFAVFLCLFSSLVVSFFTQTGVVELYRQWLDVGWYYGWNKTWSMQPHVPWFVKYVLLTASIVMVMLCRLAYGRSGIVLAGVFAVTWSYNQYYDYVLCVPLFVYLLVCGGHGRHTGQNVFWERVKKVVGVVLFSVVSVFSLVACLIVRTIMHSGWGVVSRSKDYSLKVMLVLVLLLLAFGLWEKYVKSKVLPGTSVLRAYWRG